MCCVASITSTPAAPAVPRGDANSYFDGGDGTVTNMPKAPVSISANTAHADADADADADAPAFAAAVPATPVSAGRFAATFELIECIRLRQQIDTNAACQ
eukprot:489565-Pleurochrysis_carterae.AAC.1